jgi:hypothetical protein
VFLRRKTLKPFGEKSSDQFMDGVAIRDSVVTLAKGFHREGGVLPDDRPEDATNAASIGSILDFTHPTTMDAAELRPVLLGHEASNAKQFLDSVNC